MFESIGKLPPTSNYFDALAQEILQSKRYVHLMNVALHFDGNQKHLPPAFFPPKADNPGIVVVATFYVTLDGEPRMAKIQYRCFANEGQAFDLAKIYNEIKRAVASVFYRGSKKDLYYRMGQIALEPYNWN